MGIRLLTQNSLKMKRSILKTKTPLRAKKPWNPVRKPWVVKTKLKSNSTLKSHSTLKVRKSMNKIGKVGRANLESSKRIKKITGDLENRTCEIGFEGCLYNFALTIAHRHKRAWYKGDPVLLSDPKQFVIGCCECHDFMEHNAELTEKVFMKLRGPEEIIKN
jgi:hypothetical protein